MKRSSGYDKLLPGSKIVTVRDQCRFVPIGTKLVITKVEDNTDEPRTWRPIISDGKYPLRSYICKEIGANIIVEITLYDYEIHVRGQEYETCTIFEQGWQICD